MTVFTFPGVQISTAGIATEAKQDTIITALSDVNTELNSQTALLTTMDADTGNISTEVAAINTKTPALGQALAAASVPVVLTAAQVSTLTPQTDALTNAQLRASAVPVSGPLTDIELRATAVPVSAAALPLPTGAATESTLASLNAKVTAVNTGAVTISAALPTGANTIGAVTQSGTWTVQPGNTANTTPWLVTQSGRAKANTPAYNDYTSTPVTTAAYVQLVASTTSAVNRIEIFDSSGEALYLAVGAAASEVNQLLIFPGGQGVVDLAIPASSRISIKARTATASVGFIVINFYT